MTSEEEIRELSLELAVQMLTTYIEKGIWPNNVNSITSPEGIIEYAAAFEKYITG